MLLKTAMFSLTILVVSTAFQSSYRTTVGDHLIGTYYSKIAFLHDQTETELRIKKDLLFEKTMVSSGNNYKSTITVTGKWIQQNDTLILIPLKQKKNKKTAKNESKKAIEVLNCTENINDQFCKADTLFYKDNGLWSVSAPIYKLYNRK